VASPRSCSTLANATFRAHYTLFRCLFGGGLDLVRGSLYDFAQLCEGLLFTNVCRCRLVGGASEPLECLVELRHRRVGEPLDEPRDAVEDVVHRGAVLGQMLSAFVGDLVDLLSAFLRDDASV